RDRRVTGDPEAPVAVGRLPETDTRTGGRFAVEAGTGQQLNGRALGQQVDAVVVAADAEGNAQPCRATRQVAVRVHLRAFDDRTRPDAGLVELHLVSFQRTAPYPGQLDALDDLAGPEQD